MASGFSSPYFPFKAAAIAKRDFEQHFSVDLLVKDQTLMLEEGASLKVPMPGLAALREVFQAARAVTSAGGSNPQTTATSITSGRIRRRMTTSSFDGEPGGQSPRAGGKPPLTRA